MYHYISLYIVMYHYISLYIIIYHYISLYIIIYHYISLYIIYHYISIDMPYMYIYIDVCVCVFISMAMRIVTAQRPAWYHMIIDSYSPMKYIHSITIISMKYLHDIQLEKKSTNPCTKNPYNLGPPFPIAKIC